ncbi:MAG: Unknown protein [uncultured Sulfurovum sp.]|uniref:Uncharacterized protein n=1 Tax=uncultured Sulfurovum sp. TaxID=269237 RepID=A0A6S6T4X7_9BACT|nr:MAG: Unknown protein [uncultured Sulfurovum sp.]
MLSGTTKTVQNPKPLKVVTDKDEKLGDQTTFNTQEAVDILNDSDKTVRDVGN